MNLWEEKQGKTSYFGAIHIKTRKPQKVFRGVSYKRKKTMVVRFQGKGE